MNTDFILDFFVDYYVWFIIGGVIIFLAVVGFIADKKKLIKKKKQIKHLMESSKDNDLNSLDLVEDTVLENENLKNDDLIQNQNAVVDNFDTQNELDVSKFDNEEVITSTENKNVEPENLELESNSNNKYEEKFDAILDFINEEASKNDFENSNYNKDETSIFEKKTMLAENNLAENLEDDDSKNVQKLQDKDNLPDDYSENTTLNNELENVYENIDLFKTFNEKKKMEKVDDTINKINELDFSANNNDNVISDELDFSSDEVEKDKLEDTLQISYSQLKEIVEDIIEETEKNKSISQNVSDNISSEENISYQGVTNNDLPKLDSNAIENIKNQDEEDDVWKF